MSSADGIDHSLDGESQSEGIITTSIVLVVLTAVLVALRLFTRGFFLKAFGADDVTIAISQLLAIGTAVGTVLQAQYGLGKHTWTVSAEDNAKQLKALYATISVYNPSQIFLKVSLLLLFRRLFPGQKTQWCCNALLIFIPIWGVTQEFLAGLACIPLSLMVPSMASRCITTLPIWYLTSVMNIVTDFVIFFIPIPSLVKLQLRRTPKYMLVGLFCLGFFTCIVSIIRLFTLRASIESTDPMWDNSATSLWSIIELNCGLACATLPTLRPLFTKLFPSQFITRMSNNYHQGRSGGQQGPSHQGSKGASDVAQTTDDLESNAKGLVVRREFELTVSSGSHKTNTSADKDKTHSDDGLVPEKAQRTTRSSVWPKK